MTSENDPRGQAPSRLPPPPVVVAADAALFLDFDGTLIPYAHGDLRAPEIGADLIGLLAALVERTGGASALVSGRGIGELDRLLHPARFAASGTHGAEYRQAPDEAIRVDHAADGLEDLLPLVAAWATGQHGTSVEKKPLTIVLHFHDRPEVAPHAQAFAVEACIAFPGLAPQFGRGLIEFKPRGTDKGRGIARLMDLAPFRGRRPVFIGDDLADEAGFAVVNRAGGISIKVGSGATCAGYRLKDTFSVRRYLAASLG